MIESFLCSTCQTELKRDWDFPLLEERCPTCSTLSLFFQRSRFDEIRNLRAADFLQLRFSYLQKKREAKIREASRKAAIALIESRGSLSPLEVDQVTEAFFNFAQALERSQKND